VLRDLCLALHAVDPAGERKWRIAIAVPWVSPSTKSLD
jgi:hypothetical protein